VDSPAPSTDRVPEDLERHRERRRARPVHARWWRGPRRRRARLAFTDAELHRTVDPDEDLPGRTDEAFLRKHEALPDPDDREKSFTFVEQFVPADEHVTVVGTPRQGDEPGQVVVDEAPPDDLLGTHADYTDGDGSDADAVLIRGRYGEAASQPVGGSMGRDSSVA